MEQQSPVLSLAMAPKPKFNLSYLFSLSYHSPLWRKICSLWGHSGLTVQQGREIPWKKVQTGAGKWQLICVSHLQHCLFSSPRRLIDPLCQCTRGTEIRCSETSTQSSSIQLELLKNKGSIHSAEETGPNTSTIAAIKPLFFFTSIARSLLKVLWPFGI